MKKILVLDNYDSFTFNLVHYLQELLKHPVEVRRNDEISLDEVANYDAIVLSPGPGVPSEAGIMPELILRYAGKIPVFGVCLGHQAIGEAFGAQLENLSEVYHGLETPVEVLVESELLFMGVPKIFQAGRYHSWAVRREALPDCLEITAVDEQGAIMALRHKTLNVRGVQFHPESIMTPYGKKMLENFLAFCIQ
ncbi:MAG: anthranilate synthase component II [Saprospiraceae bacterium]